MFALWGGVSSAAGKCEADGGKTARRCRAPGFLIHDNMNSFVYEALVRVTLLGFHLVLRSC